MQRVCKRLCVCAKSNREPAFRVFFEVNTGGQQPFYRKIRANAHGFPSEQRTGYIFNIVRLQDCTAVCFRPGVHGEHLPTVGRGGEHRHSLQTLRKYFCNLIGTAQMSGQERNHELSLLVNDDYRRIIGFSHQIRRHCAYRDSGRAHEHDQVAIDHRLLRKALKARARERRIHRPRVPLTPEIRQEFYRLCTVCAPHRVKDTNFACFIGLPHEIRS